MGPILTVWTPGAAGVTFGCAGLLFSVISNPWMRLSEIVDLLAGNGNVVEVNRAISNASNGPGKHRAQQAPAQARRVANPHLILNPQGL